MTVAVFTDVTGDERLRGHLAGAAAASFQTRLFTETPGAGTYAATFAVPAGTLVGEVWLLPLAAPWDATTAVLAMGDTAEPAGYFGAVDLVGGLTGAYDPTTPVSGVNFQPFGNAPGMAAYWQSDWFQSVAPGVLYESADTITASVVTTGAGGSTGRLLVVLLAVAPVTVAATKT
jgi:hypothetical protein